MQKLKSIQIWLTHTKTSHQNKFKVKSMKWKIQLNNQKIASHTVYEEGESISTPQEKLKAACQEERLYK